MPHYTIAVDHLGCFYEDYTRFTCDFCGAFGDIEDSRSTDDRQYMCPDCFQILWDAEHEAVNAFMKAESILFCTLETNIDVLLEEHGWMLEGRKAIRESIELQEQDVREQEILARLRAEVED